MDNLYTLHPVTTLFPPLPPAKREHMKEQIREHGVLVPIEVINENQIIDGRHRWEIWLELGWDETDLPVAHVDDIVDDENLQSHVIALNYSRRQLKIGQVASVGHVLAQRPHGGQSGWEHKYTLDEAADIMKCSAASIKRYRIVLKRDPALAARIDIDEIGLVDAYNRVKGTREDKEAPASPVSRGRGRAAAKTGDKPKPLAQVGYEEEDEGSGRTLAEEDPLAWLDEAEQEEPHDEGVAQENMNNGDRPRTRRRTSEEKAADDAQQERAAEKQQRGRAAVNKKKAEEHKTRLATKKVDDLRAAIHYWFAKLGQEAITVEDQIVYLNFYDHPDLLSEWERIHDTYGREGEEL